MKKSRFIPLIILPAFLMTACNLEATPESTAIVTAINYQKDNTRITFQMDDEYWTPGGKNASRRLSKGDYKPVHAALQNRLGITLLEHQAAAVSGSKKACDYFRDNWLTNQYADVAMGTVAHINNYSVSGNKETILDLKPYLDMTTFNDDGSIKDEGVLPNLAKFLYDNPSVKMSITTAKHSQPGKSAIYYIPYFDGFDDPEKMTNIRADYVEKLLDVDTTNFSTDTSVLGASGKYKKAYSPCYADANGNAIEYTVSVPNVNEKGESLEPTTISIEKKPTKNIITLQNELLDNGTASSKTFVDQFKTYIDARYGRPTSVGGDGYFKNYSDLFLDYRACYDVDEMVALMRIFKVSAGTLGLYKQNSSGEIIEPKELKEMVPWTPEEIGNSSSADLYRWAGQLFGVRGFESRNGYLYLNGIKHYTKEEGGFPDCDLVHDCRGDQLTLDMIKKLAELYKEGLLLQDFDSTTAVGDTEGNFSTQILEGKGNENYAGFMEYQYAKSEGELNKQKDKLNSKGEKTLFYDEEMNFRPILYCVANWDTDGDGERDGEYFQFTESWRSVKTSAECLRAGLVDNPEKLAAVFKYVDYAFSDDGKILYNYGPWEDGYVHEGFYDEETGKIKEQPDKDSYVTFKGSIIPKFSEAAEKQLEDIDGLQRNYIGATLPLGYIKTQGMEYQITHKNSKVGIDIINKAIECETLKHVNTNYNAEICKDTPFYKIVPSSFILTTGQASAISALLDKKKLGSMFTDSSTSNFNIWDKYVMGDKAADAPELKDYITTVNDKWELKKFVTYYQDAYEVMT